VAFQLKKPYIIHRGIAVFGKLGRNRFLMDASWLLLKSKMNWGHWKYVQGNVTECRAYFHKDASWVRAFRVWRLLHQMYAFTKHPLLENEVKRWRVTMRFLDKGKESDVLAVGDTNSSLDVGLSARELRLIYKRLRTKPNWRYMEHTYVIGRQLNQRGIGR